jgi:hypothetical protein
MIQPSIAHKYEKIPPTFAQIRYMEELKLQKRKHYEDEGLGTTVSGERVGQYRAQAYHGQEPEQHQPTKVLSHIIASAVPYDYSPPGRAHRHKDQQSAGLLATTSDLAARTISLPGAALYKQRQLDQTTPILPNGTSAAVIPRAHERVVSEPRTSLSPFEDQRRQTMNSPFEQPVGSSVLSRGTQHNPLEIESSPEPERAARPSKRRRKKFYAVTVGRVPGIYDDWDEVERQTTRFSGAKQQGFSTEEEARAFFEEYMHDSIPQLGFGGGLTRETETSTGTQQIRAHPADFEYKPPPPAEQITAPSRASITAMDSEPVLKLEQQMVVDLILEGHNVFYTGSAGCGKSTILKAFVKQLQLRGRRVKIVAPTNLAALNVGGVTTWSFAGWTPDSMKKPLDKLMQAAHGKEIWERFDTTDVLVIDEISMVENLLFERLNHVMKASRGERYGGGPFGGVQVVVTGDFCQLSPVKPFQYCIGCGWELQRDNKHRPKEYQCENKYCREDIFYDVDKWAFRSKAWEECDFKHINLTEIHRQSDKKFVSILQKIRTGESTTSFIALW